ncbi:MAG: hypothetical protein V4710_11040, partial [Verrucomicrobiota bacterium]
RPQNYEELIHLLEFARNELRKNTVLVVPGAPRIAPPAARPAAPRKEAAASKTNRAITIGTIAAVVLGGTAFYFFPDPAPAPRSSQAPVAPVQAPAATIEERFKAARAELLAGRHGKAAGDLRILDGEKNVPQSLHNWINLYQGLAEWLAGREAEGRAAFGKIEERGSHPGDESERKLSQFFLDLSHLLRDTGPALTDAAKAYNPASYQAIALLLVGLKQWNTNQFDEAAALFRQFNAAKPELPIPGLGDEAALGKLKKIARDHLADHQAFKTAIATLSAAVTPEQKKAAIDAAKSARSSLKLTGKLSRSLDATIKEREPQIVAELEKETQEQAARALRQETEDSKTLADLRQKQLLLLAQYRFGEAKTLILGAKLGGEKARREQEILAAKAEWLAKFKAALMRDLNTTGYAAAVVRKSGLSLAGGVAKADEQQLYVRTQYGLVPVAWSDISFDCAYAMAQSSIRPNLPAELAADRKWLLGVFACCMGKVTEGRTLLTEASQVRNEYNASLPLFTAEP